MPSAKQILSKLKKLENKKNKEGMARFGINTENAYGISVYVIRKMAKEMKRDHKLAAELWKTKKHEARLLAIFIDEPEKVTEAQMERWAKDFNSWDLCDLCCANLFDRTPYAYKKAAQWADRKEEFVKRAAFALIAALSVHDKKSPDSKFTKLFPLIKKHSTDERNYVKKAVNWALRQIGKRNLSLNKKAIQLAKEIKKIDSKSSRWIASDALRELQSPKTIQRLKNTKPKK